MKRIKKGRLYLRIIPLLCTLFCCGCDIEGYDYHVKFVNHTTDTLLILIKESYPDTALKVEDFETIIASSLKNDSSYFCAETVQPNSSHTIDSYCYSNAWPVKDGKVELVVFVFNKRELLHAKPTDTNKLRRAHLKTLVLSYGDVSKNAYKVDYY